MKLTFDVPEGLAEKISEEIKAALDEYKKKQVWPQMGDKYCYIEGGMVYEGEEYDEDAYDDRMQAIGNMFKTKEEANFKLEQLKVLHELEQLADDDQPWDGKNLHYKILYTRNSESPFFSIEYWRIDQHVPSQFYFKSYESAQVALNEIGENRLKKYYFCIPEEE
jgi:hypothetical protein